MEFSRPEGALSADPTLWLYTSLSSGSSTIVTATSRLETILKANRIPFKALDVATEEKARMLWGRRAGKRKLPGLVKQGMVLADLVEVEEWNEYGEVRENLLDEDEAAASPALATLSKPPVAATPPPRPEAPTPASAATHNAVAAPPSTPSAAALKAAGSISSLKSTATTASVQSGKSAESERKESMLSLAEQVAAKAKKASGLRTASGQVLGRNKADSSASKATTTSVAEDAKEKSEDQKAEKSEDAAGVKAEDEAVAGSAKPEEAEGEAVTKPTERVVPITEQPADSHPTTKAEAKPESAAEKVASTDAGEKTPAQAEAAKKEDTDEDEDEDEDSDEEEEGEEKRKTQEQDSVDIENGMVELEIQLMLNSPTMGSVRERKKRSDGGKRGVPGSPDTFTSALEEDDDLPGFHSPTMRSGGASPLSTMSPMSGFGFGDANDKSHDAPTGPEDARVQKSTQNEGLLQDSTAESGDTRELKNQRSMVTTEGSSNLEKPVVRMPSLPDDQEEVSAGCCGGLFGGGKKKKKQKTS